MAELEHFISQPDDDGPVGPVVMCCESGTREQVRLKVLIHTKKVRLPHRRPVRGLMDDPLLQGTDRTFIPNDSTNRIKTLKALQPSLSSVRFLKVKDPRIGKVSHTSPDGEASVMIAR